MPVAPSSFTTATFGLLRNACKDWAAEKLSDAFWGDAKVALAERVVAQDVS